MTAATPSRDSNPKSSIFGLGRQVFLVLFGLYVTCGAVVTVVTKAWPVFWPPQFDWISLFIGAFGVAAGAIVCGVVLGLAGLGLMIVGIATFIMQRNA